MSQRELDIATILRENGLNITRQRLLVFEALVGSEPITMYELYDCLRNQLDRASLYRIVTAYEKLGIVSRINIGWKYKIELSDKYSEHHHHLTCIKCGRIIPISETELETFIHTLATSHNFYPTEHQIEVQGYCEKCKASGTVI